MSPITGASFAEMLLPYTSSISPSPGPMAQVVRCVPPRHGKMPSPVSGRQNVACGQATTRSHERMISTPAPIVTPWTRAMTGLGQSSITLKRS